MERFKNRILSLGLLSLFLMGCNATIETGLDVPIANRFDHKIVYTTDSGADVNLLKKDCEIRRGKLNTCGSICDDQKKDMMCVQICAYTCEGL